MNRPSFLAFVVLFSSSMLMAAEKAIDQDFNDRYIAWKVYVSQPEIRVQSTAKASIDNPFFVALVEMGPSALPFIAAKMEQDPEAAVLWQAIERIAKVRIASLYDKSKNRIVFPDYPALQPNENVYLYWWKEGRQRTGDRFIELCKKWKSLKSEQKVKEAQETYQQIIDLGIPVLPYLVDMVGKEPELVSAIAELADTELGSTATAADCRRWWEKNRQKFELPMGIPIK